jgi:hypothetical protein
VYLLLIDAVLQDYAHGAKRHPTGLPAEPSVSGHAPFYLVDYNKLSKIQQMLAAIAVFIEWPYCAPHSKSAESAAVQQGHRP